MVSRQGAHAKGARIELEAKKFYESLGWTVFKPAWNRFGPKDIFGCFDLLMARKGSRPTLVQVTVPSGKSARTKKILAESWLMFAGFDLRLAVRESGGEFSEYDF